ncbi:MAG: C4-type zinc ribbon domain-containing protein [Deltaproteobacteria bacterium]|nr:C4-type zinc ribbon domain-containing protein [Deltaproteobacteria bacterium]
MLPELSQLIDLHELDKEISEVDQLLNHLPKELEALAQQLETLKSNLAARLQELEDLQKQRREAEAEVEDLEEGIKESRKRLLTIKKDLEYKAMLKEIGFKEDQRDQRETKVLELMEAIEAITGSIGELEQEIETEQHAFSRRETEVAAQVAKLREERAKLETKRVGLRKGLPAALLKRYEFINQRRNGGAVAEVRHGVCTGCHMNILPQQFIDLQKGEEILQCPHCQRILYWLGEEGAEEEEGLSRQAS